jgi:hypothetical protein
VAVIITTTIRGRDVLPLMDGEAVEAVVEAEVGLEVMVLQTILLLHMHSSHLENDLLNNSLALRTKDGDLASGLESLVVVLEGTCLDVATMNATDDVVADSTTIITTTMGLTITFFEEARHLIQIITRVKAHQEVVRLILVLALAVLRIGDVDEVKSRIGDISFSEEMSTLDI